MSGMMGMGIALAAVLGLIVGWWLGRRAAAVRAQAEMLPLTATLRENKGDLDRLRSERDGLVADRAAFQQQADELRRGFGEQKLELNTLRDQCVALTTEAARAQEQLKAGQAELASERERGQAALASERELLTLAREKLTDTFKSLAGDILKDNNAQFLGIASREFSAKEESIQKLLSPVRETLDKVHKHTVELETCRAEAYAEVLTEIKNIRTTHESLRLETTQLVQALRSPRARGNWGELQLKRCIEFAGMVERCSFDVQKHMTGNEEDAAQRPDVVVQLPNGRVIVIDAKTPLDAYLSAMGCSDDAQRALHLTAHARQVKTHLMNLGDKGYWQRFHNSPEFVVCFLPSEVLFSAALEQDANLIEFGSRVNVILATPTTLIALLKAVAYGWQQMEVTRNAAAICKAGEDLYKKLAATQGYFNDLGKALKNSVKHFNNLVGAVEGGANNLFSLSKKLHSLEIGQEEIAEVLQIESATRNLQSDHWESTVSIAAAQDTSSE